MIAALTSIATACSSSPAESNIPQIYLFLRTGDENSWQRHCCVCEHAIFDLTASFLLKAKTNFQLPKLPRYIIR